MAGVGVRKTSLSLSQAGGFYGEDRRRLSVPDTWPGRPGSEASSENV